MSQEQYDALVNDIAKAVAAKLAKEGKPAEAAPPPAFDAGEEIGRQVSVVFSRTAKILNAVPAVLYNTAQFPVRLDRSGAGGLSLWSYLFLLVASMAAVLAAPLATGLVLSGLKRRLMATDGAPVGLLAMVGLAIIEALGPLAAFAVAQIAMGAFFATAGLQGSFAATLLIGLVLWCAYRSLLRVFLRPGEASIRLAPISDDHAATLFRYLPIVVAVIIATRAWISILVLPTATAAGVFINSFIVAGTYAVVAWKCRDAVGEWLYGLVDGTGAWATVKRFLARNWIVIAYPSIAIIWAARAYGGIMENLKAPLGTIFTVNVILALVLVETLFSYIERRRAAVTKEGTTAVTPFLLRSLRVLVGLAAILSVAEVWAVSVLGMIDEAQWRDFGQQWAGAAIIVLIAFFLWEGVRFATERYVTRNATGTAIDEDAPAGEAASRLQTLVPLLRVALGVAIATIAVLMVLTSLGVNIGPILAGASIIGLAISFGSQTLVKDIVSGVFFLADDAFRVGEYIDCGKAKGTVEGFTLRSIQLRHQNGQVHTIPFGQLGQVTNFSRDWSTLKFNLRFDKDVDLEKLRKTTKKVGQEMLEDPEYKEDFLEPLKMQGVVDVADNAMVVRFKFTVRPLRPTVIQREAIKRLIPAFKASGIGFASAMVSVQSIGDVPAAAAAGAASAAASAADAAAQAAQQQRA